MADWRDIAGWQEHRAGRDRESSEVWAHGAVAFVAKDQVKVAGGMAKAAIEAALAKR